MYFPDLAFIRFISFLHEAYTTQIKGPKHSLYHEQTICDYYHYAVDGP